MKQGPVWPCRDRRTGDGTGGRVTLRAVSREPWAAAPRQAWRRESGSRQVCPAAVTRLVSAGVVDGYCVFEQNFSIADVLVAKQEAPRVGGDGGQGGEPHDERPVLRLTQRAQLLVDPRPGGGGPAAAGRGRCRGAAG